MKTNINEDKITITLSQVFDLRDRGKLKQANDNWVIEIDNKLVDVSDEVCISPLPAVQYFNPSINCKSKTNELSFAEKAKLMLKRELSIKQIMAVYGVGQTRATKIRNDAVKYCGDHKIYYDKNRNVPTDAVAAVMGYGYDYFYDMMIKEQKIDKAWDERRNINE